VTSTPKPRLTLEEATALVAAGLGEVMQKFPLRFCKPILFGMPPSPKYPAKVNNGTATLLKRNGEHFVVTCAHVLNHYRTVSHGNPAVFFAVGNCHFDPLPQIVAEDAALDICIIRMTSAQVREVVDTRSGIGQDFFELDARTTQPVKTGEFVTFAGFPGDLRRLESLDAFNFGTYSSGAARVTDRHIDYLVCQFERECWVRSGDAGEPEPDSLGGMSGGPAFVVRHSPEGIISYEFSGIIYKMHEASESLYIRELSPTAFGEAA
jgi:Trypsin-like peptidase domain